MPPLFFFGCKEFYLIFVICKKCLQHIFPYMNAKFHCVIFSPLLISGDVLQIVCYAKFWLNFGSK